MTLALTSLLNGRGTTLGRTLYLPPPSVLGTSGAGIQIMDLFTVAALPGGRQHSILNDDHPGAIVFYYHQ